MNVQVTMHGDLLGLKGAAGKTDHDQHLNGLQGCPNGANLKLDSRFEV